MIKKLRIKKNEEIEKLIKIKDTVGDKFFVIYKSKNDLSHFRYALSVSKKYGKAHDRNLAKRRVRNVIKEYNYLNYDFFIVIKPNAKELSYEEIEKIVKRLLLRHQLIKEN